MAHTQHKITTVPSRETTAAKYTQPRHALSFIITSSKIWSYGGAEASVSRGEPRSHRIPGSGNETVSVSGLRSCRILYHERAPRRVPSSPSLPVSYAFPIDGVAVAGVDGGA